MSNPDINLHVEQIANGFLLSGNATVSGDYRTAYTDRVFVSSREEVIAGLAALFEKAEALRPEDAKDDF